VDGCFLLRVERVLGGMKGFSRKGWLRSAPPRRLQVYSGADFAMASYYEQAADGGALISEAGRAALHDGIGKMPPPPPSLPY
jgi:hypothetical protein